jgi:hypothetical protein
MAFEDEPAGFELALQASKEKPPYTVPNPAIKASA